MNETPASLTIEEVAPDFPSFRVAFAFVEDIGGGPPGPGVEALAAAAEAEAASFLASREIAELPEIANWRAAYRAFGSKKTSYRNSCEALLRRIRGGAGLPRVHPLVDLYNALSVKYRVPAGADDLAHLTLPLAFRYARPGDSFLDLARDPPVDDPPFDGEVVLADAEKVLCRRWNWRQDVRSRIRAKTTAATLVIQTLEPDGEDRLSRAAEDFARHARDDLGAACRWAIASAARPRVDLSSA
jgi:DNA/RNA-binding domain of Phe-tRNA-synthetase-like protein